MSQFSQVLVHALTVQGEEVGVFEFGVHLPEAFAGVGF
jgi:hypothetical protein